MIHLKIYERHSDACRRTLLRQIVLKWESMSNRCEKLDKLLECQREVITRHIDEHKWFAQEPDREKGIADFIKRYAWLMREMFCAYSCELRNECELAKKMIKK